MPSQTARPCQLSLSLLTLALFSGFAHAADTTAQTSELQPVTVKGANLSTHRVTTQKIDESTDTDLKGLLFNEPSIGFGGGNGTSQWVNIRGLGQDQIDFKVDDAYSDTTCCAPIKTSASKSMQAYPVIKVGIEACRFTAVQPDLML